MPWRYLTAGLNVSLLQLGITAAQNSATATATALAALIGAQNGDASSGIEITVDFTDDAAGVLDSDWTVETLSGTPYTGIYAPSSPPSGFENGQGISTPIAWFTSAIPGGFHASETLYHRHNTVLTTDSAEVSVVLGTYGGEGDASLHVFTHAASNLADFMRVSVRKNHFWWGPATYSAGTYGWTDWNDDGFTFSKGDTVTISNQGTLWTLKRNGVIVDTQTDSGGDAFYDASHRYWGFILEIQNELVALTDVSFGVSSIVASDVEIPAYLGTGWRLSRTSTSNTGGLSSGATAGQVPASTYDTTGPETNCTVQSLGLGEILIPKDGRYVCTVTHFCANAFGTGASLRPCLGRRASVGGALTWIAEGGEGSANADEVSSTFIEYFTAGQLAVPGYAGNSIGNAFRGEAAGAKHHFAGSRLPTL